MDKSNKIQRTKKALLEALEKSLGIVTTACRSVDINRTTFYRYLKDDKEFAVQVKDVENIALDFAESQLLKNIKEGKEPSTIFYMKTKGQKRGYIEKQQIEHSGGVTINETKTYDSTDQTPDESD